MNELELEALLDATTGRRVLTVGGRVCDLQAFRVVAVNSSLISDAESASVDILIEGDLLTVLSHLDPNDFDVLVVSREVDDTEAEIVYRWSGDSYLNLDESVHSMFFYKFDRNWVKEMLGERRCPMLMVDELVRVN